MGLHQRLQNVELELTVCVLVLAHPKHNFDLILFLIHHHSSLQS